MYWILFLLQLLARTVLNILITRMLLSRTLRRDADGLSINDTDVSG
jgi:hypothetical protein